MNQLPITQLLQELYELDPALRAHETELKILLEKMLRARPEVKVDQVFAQNLRRTLLSTNPKNTTNFISYLSSMLKKPVLLAGAATLGAVLLVSAYLLNQNSGEKFTLDTSRPSLSIAGVLPRNAFGPLSANMVQAPLGSAEMLSARQGGGVPSPAASTNAAVSDFAISEPAVTGNNPVSGVAQDKMIAPFYTYQYKYTGEPLSLTETEVSVFRRVKDIGLARDFAQALIEKNNGMLDLSKFGDAYLQTFQIAQNKNDGYMINVDVQNGTVNVNPQYERWYPVCYTANCPQPKPLTESDVPSDEKVIAIANDFLDDFGVNRAQYGTPVVDDTWKNNYPMPLAERSVRSIVIDRYIPDVVTVIYPINIEGQKITENNGQDFGLRVNVDIRKMKGQGLWNLFTNQYQRSNYQAETDAARILKIAENGGSGWYAGPAEQVRTLNLGTPEKIYIPHYQFVPENGTANELFLPALKFPITNIPEDQPYFYQKFIIVPLVKEVLSQYEPQGQPPVNIMPLTKEEKTPVATSELR